MNNHVSTRRISALLVFFAAAFLGGYAAPIFAQTACPQGVAAGSAQCGPSGGGYTPSTPRVPQARWVSTWGAFASSSVVVGTSTGQKSKRKAQKAAMKKCEEMGGKDCRPIYEYTNSCVVAAGPISPPDAGTAIYQNGRTLEEATGLGLAECAKANSGLTCEIKYSNCTEPYLVYD